MRPAVPKGLVGDVLRELSACPDRDGALFLYGSVAARMYTTLDAPSIDIDLIVEPGVAERLYRWAVDELGFECAPHHPLLERNLLRATDTEQIEIHDFEHPHAAFFLFRRPKQATTWGRLREFGVAVPELDRVVVADLPLLCFMYIKYFDDWRYLSGLTAGNTDLEAYVATKWPSLVSTAASLLAEAVRRKQDAWLLLLDIRERAHALGMPSALDALPALLAYIRELQPPSAAAVADALREVEPNLWCLAAEVRSKRSGAQVLFFQPSTSRILALTDVALTDVDDHYSFDRSSPWPTPNVANIQITDRCNLSCDHCAFGRGRRNIEIRVFEDILDMLDGIGVFEINLGEGGEATLHPELPTLLRLATERGFNVGLTSNLSTALPPRELDAIAEHVTSVHTSFDQLHFAARDYRDTLFRNLEQLNARGCRLGINIAYTPGQLAELDATVTTLLPAVVGLVRQVSILKVSVPGVSESHDDADIDCLAAVFRKLAAAGLDVGRHACDPRAAEALRRLGHVEAQAHCPAWSDSVYVDVDGRLSPCGIRPEAEPLIGIRRSPDFSDQRFNAAKQLHMCAYRCN